jgi:hypothetical protein
MTDRARRAALLLVLIAAATLRLRAVGFGHDRVLFVTEGHPVYIPHLSFQIDEDHNVGIPLGLSWGDLNPHGFYLPSLLWYLLFALDQAVYLIGRALGFLSQWSDLRALFDANPTPFFLLGRTLNVAIGTATVGGLYLLTRRLCSAGGGLLAAAFLAGTFLHIRDSALATTDAPTALFIVLSLLGAVGVLQVGRRRDYALAAIAAGLAMATKYNALLVLAALVVAHGLRGVRGGAPIRRLCLSSRLLGALALAVLVFVVVNPYLLLDWTKAMRDVLWNVRVFEVEGRFARLPPAWWYHFSVSLRYGMGVGLLALALIGIARTLWRRDAGGCVLVGFAVVFYGVMGTGRLIHARYMTPLLPVLCAFAAVAVLELATRIPWPRWRPWTVAAIGVLAMLEPLHSATSYARMVQHVDTRVEAYEFLLTLPPESDVATYGPSEVWRSTIPRWQPSYYARHPRQTWPEVLAVLKARNIRYLLAHHSGLEVFSPALPELEAALRASATLVREFDPDRRGATPHAVYDGADPYYFPLGGWQGVVRPGPRIRLYRLD